MRAGALLGVLVAAVPVLVSGAPASVSLPGGERGIGFDNLRFDPTLGVLAPAGRTGALDSRRAEDPGRHADRGLRADGTPGEGHDQGVTSVDVGEGWLFATDRTARVLAVVDPRTRRIAARVSLAGAPDYVRYVAATRELWVTQPAQERIEMFALSSERPPTPKHLAFLPVPGGPESLAIDGKRARAYTHKWKRETVAIDSGHAASSRPGALVAGAPRHLDRRAAWFPAGRLRRGRGHGAGRRPRR